MKGMEIVPPGLTKNLSHRRVLEQRRLEAQQTQAATSNMDGLELSIKEVVEAYAEQHDLIFKPRPGRMHNGLQIYGFGSVSIIVDSLNQRIYVYTQTEKVWSWSLVSLQGLLDLHKLLLNGHVDIQNNGVQESAVISETDLCFLSCSFIY